MGQFDYVIAISSQENEDVFFKKFEQALRSMNTHIQVGELHKVHTRAEIDHILEETANPVVLCCMEHLEDDNIGPGTIKKLIDAYTDVRIILFFSDDKYGKGKLNSHFEKGYYNGCFNKDFTMNTIRSLSLKDRTKEDAYIYYGINVYEERGGKRADKIEQENILGQKQSDFANSGNSQISKNKKEHNAGQASEDTHGLTIPKKENMLDEQNVKSDQEEDVLYSVQPNPVNETRKVDAFKNNKENGDTEKPAISTNRRKEKKKVEEKQDDDNLAGQRTEHKQKWENEFGRADELTPYCVYVAPEDDAELNGILKVENFILKEELIRYEERLLDYYAKEEPNTFINLWNGTLSKESFEKRVLKKIDSYGLTGQAAEEVFKHFLQGVFAYDYLEPFLDDDFVSDIKLLAPDNIQLTYKGMRIGTNVKFRSQLHYDNFIELCARRNNVLLTEHTHQQTFMDIKFCKKAFLRITMSMKHVNTFGGYYLHIRKTPKVKYSMETLIEKGMLTPSFAARIIRLFKEGKNFFISGKGSAGKSSLLNALLDAYPLTKAGLIIQEDMGLYVNGHPNMMYMNVVRTTEGDEVVYSLKDITKKALLMDIDGFFIGETKGEEAVEVLAGMRSGNQFAGTVHALSAREALPNYVNYAMYAGQNTTREEFSRMATAINYVIQLEQFKVVECVQVDGWDSEVGEFKYSPVDIT